LTAIALGDGGSTHAFCVRMGMKLSDLGFDRWFEDHAKDLLGPSHVLPTGGTARFKSGLSVLDFIKRVSLISYTREDLARVRNAIRAIGDAEGLTAHVRAVEKRFEE